MLTDFCHSPPGVLNNHDMFMHFCGGGVGHKYMQAIEAAYKNMSHEQVHYKEHKHKPLPGKDAMDVNNAGTSTSESELDPGCPKTDQHAGLGEDCDSNGASGGSRGSSGSGKGSDEGGGGDEVDGSNGGSHVSVWDSDEVASEDDWQDESDGFADL